MNTQAHTTNDRAEDEHGNILLVNQDYNIADVNGNVLHTRDKYIEFLKATGNTAQTQYGMPNTHCT